MIDCTRDEGLSLGDKRRSRRNDSVDDSACEVSETPSHHYCSIRLLNGTTCCQAPHKRAVNINLKISHGQHSIFLRSRLTMGHDRFPQPLSVLSDHTVVFSTAGPVTPQAPRMAAEVGTEKMGVGKGGSRRSGGHEPSNRSVCVRWDPFYL
jgi:hypothetical protein